MERITVLCFSNLTGNDKFKLLVIGKSLLPCFKNVNVDNPPVTYRANKKAWMTSQIFTKWLATWSSYLTNVNLKILLLGDNCTAHPHVSTLKNIQLEFLRPNTTSVIQLNGSENHKELEDFYRKELVHMTLAYREENILNPSSTASSTAIDVSSKISIPQAVSFVAKRWRAIK